KKLKPSQVIFQWSIALQGLPLGYISTKLSKDKTIEVIFDMHFVIQKENSSIDRFFPKMGIRRAATFIVHAMKTSDGLQELYPAKTFSIAESAERTKKGGSTVIKLFHPIYDLFSPDPNFDVEGFKSKHGLKKHVFLYFGFIRKYKGLHNAIKAFAKLAAIR